MLDNDILREALKPYPCRPEDIRRGEGGPVGCLGTALLPDLQREPRGLASAGEGPDATVGRTRCWIEPPAPVDSTASDLRVSPPVASLRGRRGSWSNRKRCIGY